MAKDKCLKPVPGGSPFRGLAEASPYEPNLLLAIQIEILLNQEGRETNAEEEARTGEKEEEGAEHGGESMRNLVR